MDDLGRIVIPKEIRRKIFGKDDTEGKAIEICVEDDDIIVLKPYRKIKMWEPVVDLQGNLTGVVCECGYNNREVSNYCPNCGIKMDNFDMEERIQKAIKNMKKAGNY